MRFVAMLICVCVLPLLSGCKSESGPVRDDRVIGTWASASGSVRQEIDLWDRAQSSYVAFETGGKFSVNSYFRLFRVKGDTFMVISDMDVF